MRFLRCALFVVAAAEVRVLPLEEDWPMCGVIARLGLCEAVAALESESVAARLQDICLRCPSESVDADCPLQCVACSPEARSDHDVACARPPPAAHAAAALTEPWPLRSAAPECGLRANVRRASSD